MVRVHFKTLEVKTDDVITLGRRTILHSNVELESKVNVAC